MPRHLLGPDFVSGSFYRTGQSTWATSAASIRKGIKVLLKKYAERGIARAAASLDDAAERDAAIAMALCDDPRARSHLHELELAVDETKTKYGRATRRTAFMRPNCKLADVLWLPYKKGPELKPILDWIRSISVNCPDIGPGLFLTAAALESALADGATLPPSENGLIDLARAVLISAALLPVEERSALIDVAARIDIAVPTQAPPPDETRMSATDPSSPPSTSPFDTDESVAGLAAHTPVDAVRLADALPRLRSHAVLVPSDAGSRGAFHAVSAGEASAGRLRAAFARREAATAAFKAGHTPTTAELVELQPLAFADWHARLVAARDATQAWRDAVQNHLEGARRTFASALDLLDLGGTVNLNAWGPDDPAMSIEALEGVSRTADALLGFARFFDPTLPGMEDWRTAAKVSLDAPAVAEAIRALPTLHARGVAARAAAQEFLEATRAFLSDPVRTGVDVTEWLAILENDEVACLLGSVEMREWPLLGAALFRHGLDNGAGEFAKVALPFLRRSAVAMSTRRDLLRYIDPATSAMDTFPDARRIVALERFRDALWRGPAALVTDPSSGLSDRTVVGEAVAGIVELVTQHLDLVGNEGDLRRILHRPDEGGAIEAERALTTFATTPNSMKGTFRHLREGAREMMFLPLIRGERVDAEAARSLAERLGASRDDAVAEVSDTVEARTRPTPRIEARHRLSLERYVSDGQTLVEAYLSSLPASQESRVRAFSEALAGALPVLSLSEEAEVGSLSWLETMVRRILQPSASGEDFRSEADEFDRLRQLTLTGTPQAVAVRSWSNADTLWMRGRLDLPEFHLDPDRYTVLETCASCLRWWAEARRPDPPTIFNHLVERREFRAAVAMLEDAEAPSADDFASAMAPADVKAARERLLVAFADDRGQVVRRLDLLTERFGAHALSGAATRTEIERALDGFDADAALEWCDLLEAELTEARETEPANAPDPADEARRVELTRLLILAGAGGIDPGASLEELDLRWSDERRARMDERKHLAVLDGALGRLPGTVPELTSLVASLRRHDQEADHWLPPDRASDLAFFARDPALKLGTWLAAAPAFEPEARAALVRLASWFFGFVEERTAALRALGDGDSTDDVLERVVAVRDRFEAAGDPGTCVASLLEAGELTESELHDPPGPVIDEADGGVSEPVENDGFPASGAEPASALLELTTAAAEENWSAVIEGIGSVRKLSENQDQLRRLDEMGEFARTVELLEGGRGGQIEATALAAAARTLGASSGLVQRSIPTKRQLEIAFALLATATNLDAGLTQETVQQPDRDGSWAPILGRRGELLRQLPGQNAPVHTGRVLEQLCAGSLGNEIVERLWEAVTNIPEVGAARAGLLTYLHDHGLDHHVVQLAARYDVAIKGRLRQLLDLRTVAAGRPDLVRVAQTVAEQVAAAAKSVAFRTFVKSLPSAAQSVEADLRISVENHAPLRWKAGTTPKMQLPITVEPRGLVPEHIEVALFPEDDVTFDDGTRRCVIAAQPVYVAGEHTLPLRFGETWIGPARGVRPQEGRESFRIRVSARALTGELINRDTVCAPRVEQVTGTTRRVDNDTLLEAYPGVEATPAAGEGFVGRGAELERLHEVLVTARRPSPVLLTGMRRVGKTSLLYAFHKFHSQPGRSDVITVYLSLAERGGQFLKPDQDVGSVVFGALAHSLGKRNFGASDHNRAVNERLRMALGGDRGAVRGAILDCREPESLADSIVVLAERLLSWLGGGRRVVFLFDEAEALVHPYRAGGAKRVELEQLLQSLREVSQTAANVGILLSGSNHIVEFAREYKNAFFGSCARIDLAGIDQFDDAKLIVSPHRIAPFVTFERAAIQQAIDVCRGMPQFMWQLGASTVALVRGGTATRADVRRAVSVLVGEQAFDLPFRPYDVLEPVEHMLNLQGRREQDLLWLLLWRVANTSSLVAEEAQQHFIIDQTLLELEDNEAWKQRLLSLVDLDILHIPRPGLFSFRVPIFAEGFRAPRHEQQFTIRRQRALAL